ncbi:MAG: membrane-bound lytic murein transglycosylase D [Halieaceae bacterium]|jgi:membrane-bound lytic murein transglycosylase D
MISEPDATALSGVTPVRDMRDNFACLAMCRAVGKVTLLAVLLAGCAGTPEQGRTGREMAEPSAGLIPSAHPQPEARSLAPPVDLWDRIRRQLTMHTLHNGRIGAARDHYLQQTRYLELIGPRAERYLYYIVAEVERRQLPIELVLLPLVESALNPFAYSGQRAAGLWQIMPATADYLGMRRDWWFDGRLDIRDSTAFALDYLERLNRDFDGDWLLTLAAYNAGKGRVRRALARNRKEGLPLDYWSLKLPQETRRYIPRLIALSTLVAFDVALGLELPPIPNQPAFAVVDTGGQIEMLRASELAGFDITELRRFNPGQLRWATAPGGRDELLFPVADAANMRERLAALPADQRVTWQHYRIRRGDSLIRIAGRFDTQVDLLREVNNLRGNLIRAGDTLMIPDSQAWRASLAMAEDSETGAKRGYTVRSGDSLYEIASRFKVSIDDIINWNQLDPSRYLKPGQSLTLYVSDG